MDKYGPDLLSAKVLPWAIRDFIIDQGGPESIRQSIWSEHFNKEYLKHVVRGASKETAIARAHTYCNLKVVEMAHKAGYLEKLEIGKNSREPRESEWIYVKSSEELKNPACAQNLAKESALETMTTLNTPTEAGDKQDKPLAHCRLRKLFAEAKKFATHENYHLDEDKDAGDAQEITSMVVYSEKKYVVCSEIMQLLIGLWKFVTEFNRQTQDSVHTRVFPDSRQMKHEFGQMSETENVEVKGQNMHLMVPSAGKKSISSAIVHLARLLRANLQQHNSGLLFSDVSLSDSLKVNPQEIDRMWGRINLCKDLMPKFIHFNSIGRNWVSRPEEIMALETEDSYFPCVRYKSNTTSPVPIHATRSWLATQFRLCQEIPSTGIPPRSSLNAKSAEAKYILVPSSHPCLTQSHSLGKNSIAVSTIKISVALDTEQVIAFGRPRFIVSLELLSNSTIIRQHVLREIKTSLICPSVNSSQSFAGRYIEQFLKDLHDLVPVTRMLKLHVSHLQLSSSSVDLKSAKEKGCCSTNQVERDEMTNSPEARQKEDIISPDCEIKGCKVLNKPVKSDNYFYDEATALAKVEDATNDSRQNHKNCKKSVAQTREIIDTLEIYKNMEKSFHAATCVKVKTKEYQANNNTLRVHTNISERKPPDNNDINDVREPISEDCQDTKDRKKKKSLGGKFRALFKCFKCFICGRKPKAEKGV